MKLSAIVTTLIYASSAAARMIWDMDDVDIRDQKMLAMERDVAPVAHITPNHVPRLRGAKHVMSSDTDAVLDYSHESLTSLANSYRMTAQALLNTADLAMDLSTLEDLYSLEEAKGQVLRAAQVAQNLGDDAANEAKEVFESVLSIHHKASSPSTEQMFYYSSAKAVHKSKHAAHKAEQKTHEATTKVENKTQKALNKANRKTEIAIHKANYKVASAVANAEASAASSCLVAADALNKAAELTANAISNGTAETVDAAKLAAYEASNAVMVTNDSLTHAAKVVMSALNW